MKLEWRSVKTECDYYDIKTDFAIVPGGRIVRCYERKRSPPSSTISMVFVPDLPEPQSEKEEENEQNITIRIA
jgi:hypothetical protein